MSKPNETVLISSTLSLPPEADGGEYQSMVSRLYGSFLSAASSCHGFWHNAALVVPCALFIMYLGFQVRRNVKKLRRGRSYVMIAYYVLLWCAAILDLAWSSLQVQIFIIFEQVLMLEFLWTIFSFQFPNNCEGQVITFIISGIFQQFKS